MEILNEKKSKENKWNVVMNQLYFHNVKMWCEMNPKLKMRFAIENEIHNFNHCIQVKHALNS